MNSGIDHNRVVKEGGGIYVYFSNNIKMFNSTILNNLSKEKQGGGIYFDNCDDI